MVITNDFQCNVCNSITRIKVQLGWLNNYPVRIKCGNCHISIFGNVSLNPGLSIKLNNVTPLEDMGKPDFLIEVSGELLTDKMSPFTKERNIFFSPFLKNGIHYMGENFEKFTQSTNRFLYNIENDWPTLKRINELWFNGNHTYLPKEIHKLLSKTEFPADNELELLRAVHVLNFLFTNTFADKYFKEISTHIFKEFRNINDSNQLILLAKHFESHLNDFEQKLLGILNKFIEKFHMFIPIYGLDFYSEEKDKEEVMKNLGLTTVDFEDIKDFYIDTFEDIGDILNLVVAYNNLKHRADYKKMKENVIKEILVIEDYMKMRNKGRKLEFINGEESFDKIFVSKVDNRLRNAIGHRSYTYDVITQELTYYPSGENKKGTPERLYLTEFVLECFQLMRSCIGLSEIVYQTRKSIYVSQGMFPRTKEDYYPSSTENNANYYQVKNKKRSTKVKNKKKISKKSRQHNRNR
ncbi:metal-binding protein [Peribacillus frigoritolerans]|uniref:metal-binding protein n=1 Tax=Peribacillus frigoritolerans TaxID=450367 RepID=UPI00105A6858|nr:metal-binding protein [Peribacillus frigoritolerans]TDL80967.1 metal-binding protein [Peribacillus frigoritolerans]